MSKYSYLVKNIGLFTLTNFALKLVTFVLVPVYTYYLTAMEYGITDMLLTTINMIMPIATLSIADSTLRFCFEKSENAIEYASVGFGVMVISCGVVALLLPCLDFNFFGGLGDYKLWFFGCYAVMALQLYLSNLARGVGKVSTMAAASIISSLANIGLTLLTIVVLHWGMFGYFFSLLVANLLGCLWYLIPSRLYRYIRFKTEYYKKSLRPMLAYSLPLVPNALSWWMTQNINRFFITGMIGIAASGMFAAASKIPGFLKLITGIFEQAWNLSAFQQFKSQSKERFFSVIFSLYNTILVLGVVLFMPLLSWIASLMLQKEFYSAWTLIPFLLLSFYYSTLSAYYGSIYTSSMKTRYLFVTTIIGAVSCVVLNYVLLMSCGLIGACLASMVSNATIWLLRVWDSRKILRIEVSVVRLVVVNVLMIVSALLTIYQPACWVIYTVAIVVLVAAVQFFEVRPVLQTLVRKIDNR